MSVPPLSVFSVLASVFGAVLQGADAPSAIPILTTGALFSICTAAVGYGVVKSKADAANLEITQLRGEVRAGFGEINKQLNDIQRDLGRIEGQQ